MDPRNADVLAEGLAHNFHDSYEHQAPEFGYKTRKESAVPWEEVPLANRQLMIAVCREVVIEQLTLMPCHVTGMHTPDHAAGKEKRDKDGMVTITEGYTCSLQADEALKRFISSVGGENRNDLPRDLHPEGACGWCHRIPTQRRYQKQLRRTWAWAGRKLRIPRDKLAKKD